MGIRLYPMTSDDSALEKLAGVSAGTRERLREAEKTRYDDYLEYIIRPGNEELFKLNQFLVYGWGKFYSYGYADGDAGSTTDRESIARLFEINGIKADIALCDGVCWS